MHISEYHVIILYKSSVAKEHSAVAGGFTLQLNGHRFNFPYCYFLYIGLNAGLESFPGPVGSLGVGHGSNYILY